MRFSVSAVLMAATAFVSAALVVATDVTNAAGSNLASRDQMVILPDSAVQPSPQLPMQDIAPVEAPSFDTQMADRADPLPKSEADDAPASSLNVLVERESADISDLDSEARCLATAVFYEARAESLAGKLAVARVVINRARSGRFPSSLCGVVAQRGQFSFVRGGQIPAAPEKGRQWVQSAAIAKIALNDGWESKAEGALFFHARHVSPGWGRPLLARVDNHLFYR